MILRTYIYILCVYSIILCKSIFINTFLNKTVEYPPGLRPWAHPTWFILFLAHGENASENAKPKKRTHTHTHYTNNKTFGYWSSKWISSLNFKQISTYFSDPVVHFIKFEKKKNKHGHTRSVIIVVWQTTIINYIPGPGRGFHRAVLYSKCRMSNAVSFIILYTHVRMLLLLPCVIVCTNEKWSTKSRRIIIGYFPHYWGSVACDQKLYRKTAFMDPTLEYIYILVDMDIYIVLI